MAGPVAEGDILAGKYRVEQVLGTGGMGVVVAAHHLQLDERVALKFLLPSALETDELVARFSREARVAVKIKSEHVAHIIDVGTLENGAPYMVMEYLQGKDLSQLIASRGPLPVADTVEYVLQACEAIAEAHALGIVHRDLKPANLFLTHRADGSPCIKVLDFGISKVSQFATGAGGASFSMTSTSTMLGSPYYMSPEQISSAKTVDARTDIWALGVIAYQLLAGRPPFTGENLGELCAQILQDSPPSLTELNLGIPGQLEQAILGALEKTRGQRYPDVAAFAQALSPFAPPRAQLSVERVSSIGHAPKADLAKTDIVVPNTQSSPTPAAQPATTPQPVNASAAIEPGTLDQAWNRSARRSQAPSKLTRLGLWGAGVALLIIVALLGIYQFLRAPTRQDAAVSSSVPSAASPLPTATPIVQSATAHADQAPIAVLPVAAVSATAASAITGLNTPGVHRMPSSAASSAAIEPVKSTAHAAVSSQATPAASPQPTEPNPNLPKANQPSISDLLDGRH